MFDSPANGSSESSRTRPTIFVLYGATGDLSRRQILPAFYELARLGRMPARWRLVGNGRGDLSESDFQHYVEGVLRAFAPTLSPAAWKEFSQHLRFAGDGFDTDGAGSLLDVLAEAELELAGETRGDVQYVHYLAIPPSAFLELTRDLEAHGFVERSRVVYEKPYGTSLANFEQLDAEVQRVFAEGQIYRVDHILALEAMQDVVHARFTNPWLAAIWNRQHIAQVQVDIPETLDVAQRASFYDSTGAFLDVVVTHLFQMAATVAMGPPSDLSPGALRQARDAALQRFRELDPAEVVLGQFVGYTDIEGVPSDSQTDTLAAARLWVDDERWHGVPFLLRSGKKMAADEQRVTLVLKDPDEGPYAGSDLPPSTISFALHGGGEISMSTTVRRPGLEGGIVQGVAKLSLEDLDGATTAMPYAHLIDHVLSGNQSLFTGADGLRAVWTCIEPILNNRPQVLPYATGSWEPEAVNALAMPGRWFLS